MRRKPMTPERWLTAERGWTGKRKSGPRLSVALLYPNTYHLGMSSLGYQITYRVIQDHPGAWAERFFLDSVRFGSLESGTALQKFDLIALSASYELDEPLILDIFDSMGMPLEARDRTEKGRWPLVVMGGVLVAVNRLPLYPFIDAFIHGDSEAALPPILDALSQGKSTGSLGHRGRLEAIDHLPGVEVTPGARVAAGLPLDSDLQAAASVPSDSETAVDCSITPPAAATLERLDSDLCATQILTPHTEFSDMVLVDLGRGCPHHCTFCWIGHNTPPFRARNVDTIFRAIESWSPLTDRIGLVASAVGAHPQIDEICRWIMRRGLRVSYSSLRVEEVTPTMLEALAQGGQKTMTIAPEAGGHRLRRLLGKTITDDQIIEVVERALSLGTENIKLYTMIGIPSETEEEVMELVEFSERVRRTMLKWARPKGRLGYLGINLGIFVPKPNLPLNRIEPIAPAEVKRRLRKVVRALKRIPNTRVAVSSPDLAAAQTVLSMGGIEASRYLGLVRTHGGDWRRANREWKKQSEIYFEQRLQQSRLSSEAVRQHSGAPAPS